MLSVTPWIPAEFYSSRMFPLASNGIKKGEKGERKRARQHLFGSRESNSPLALAVVALVPLVALVCVRVIVALTRMGTKKCHKRTKNE